MSADQPKESALRDDQVRDAALARYAYDPLTGVFTSKRTGKPARAKNEQGYITLGGLDGTRRAHRVAWLIVHGDWPEHVIDHINGDRADNRIANLRDVPRAVNMQNQRQSRRDSSTGFQGIHPTPDGKFRAQVKFRGKKTSHGTFLTPEAAHEAYLKAKRAVHEGCTI